MKIPTVADFAAWNKGLSLSDEQLTKLEAFFAQMLAGSEALGSRYELATWALRQEHECVKSLIYRRRLKG